MLKKKSTSREKKRKHSQSEEQHVNRRRRCTESSLELDSKDDLADPELDKIGSDIEDGGLDLNTPFQSISAYVSDRREMLEQCFHVLGEKRLQKMLPDELKSCSLDEIKSLCWEQLEQVSQRNLLQILGGQILGGQILGGEELTSGDANENTEAIPESQQDNNVDSTSSLKESAKSEDTKQEGGGSGEESDVLSINADTYDSDIEVHKEQPPAKTEEGTITAEVISGEISDPATKPDPAKDEPTVDVQPIETKKELENDIDKSVSEILASSSVSGAEEAKEQKSSPQSIAVGLPAQSVPVAGPVPVICQPSVQQLELLELEMRARAIKALMKASDVKKA